MIRNLARWICFHILIVVFSILITLPACAFWSAQGEGCSIDLGGSIRSTAAGIRNYDDPLLFGWNNDYDGSSQSILRITSTGDLPHDASFEIHLLGEVFSTSANQGSSFAGSSFSEPFPKQYRITRGSWELAEDDDFSTSLDADRLNIKYTFSDLDITLGRQAVNFSQAYFWNPLDVFLAFDPETFDRDYKPGIDALRADLTLGNFSGLTLVAAPGREMEIDHYVFDAGVFPGPVNMYGSAFIARFGTNIRDFDLTIQGGKIYGGYQIGWGFSGEVFDAGIRGEASYVLAHPDGSKLIMNPLYPAGLQEIDLVKDHYSVVVGTDYRFDNSLYVNLEYLFNSAGKTGSLNETLLRSMISNTKSLGRHLAGLQLSYEIHALLTGQVACIYSFSDRSSMVSPTATYSVADEAEFSAGAILGFGKRPTTFNMFSANGVTFNIGELNSEFGTYPNVFFMEFKFYF